MQIVTVPPEEADAHLPERFSPGRAPGGLTATEGLGVAALALRESARYLESKATRPRDGEPWNMPGCIQAPPAGQARSVGAAGPTSEFLEGSVSTGIVIVQGPTADLRFTDAEVLAIVAEVQNGLTSLAASNPLAAVTFTYNIQNVNLTVPADPNAPDLESLWRDPAMASLSFAPDWTGVNDYVESLRTQFETRSSYCGFFTKYPVNHFAYALIGGP
ncbi:hypothetical protein GY21_06265, partial [Cryobacterium roopkundense]